MIKKVRCPDCRSRFEIDYSDYDEGDVTNCPDCNLELTVIYAKEKPKLKPSKELYFDEEDEDTEITEDYDD